MPKFCMVVNCGSNSARDTVSFFRIPSEYDNRKQIDKLASERRESVLKRADLIESKIKYRRICAKHFISGKPSKLEDRTHPDWTPSINMDYEPNTSQSSSFERYDRLNKRKRLVEEGDQFNLGLQSSSETVAKADNSLNEEQKTEDVIMQQRQKIENLHKEILERDKKLYELQEKVDKLEFNMNYFKENNDFTLYYTGLPEFKYVKSIYDVIEIYLPSLSAISKFAQLILTLMKLWLNTPFKELGFRFHIHHTTAARIFYRTIDILYQRLKVFIVWPAREEVIKNMPHCFQEHFGKTTTAAAKTWSNYKHHHTIKFLIGITPQGAICFISNAYGGRTSDKFITENSGFLDQLQPGDLVIADRGFLISESVSMCIAEVVTPAFSKGRKHLSAKEIESTRKTASVRIHVERVIGMLRQKYTILKDTLPLQALKEPTIDEQFVVIDQIVVVCCVFINLSPPIIPLL